MVRSLSLVVAVQLLLGGSALAQGVGGGGGADAVIQGTGYPLGESTVFHPHVGLKAGVVSNVFFEEAETTSSAVMRVLAGFDVESIPAGGRGGAGGDGASAQKVADWSVGLHLRYDEYLHSSNVVKTQSSLALKASGRFVLFPEGPVQLFATDDFTRDTRSHNFEHPGTLNRYVNRFTLGVQLRPSGSALSGALRYQNTIDWFENFDFANRIQHRFIARGDLRLFPRTQIYAQASQGIYGSFRGGGSLSGMPYPPGPRSYPLDLRVGADTLITPLTSARVFAGWGWGFYEGDTPTYSSAVYGTELGWRYSPLGRLLFQFQRRFNDSINANFYADYAVQLKAVQQLSVFQASAAAKYISRTYRGLPEQITMEERRTDDIVQLEVAARYYFKDWLAASGSYTMSIVNTDFRYAPDMNMPGVLDDPSYVRHELFAGVRASF